MKYDLVKDLMQKNYSENYPVIEKPEEDIDAVAIIHCDQGMMYSEITDKLLEADLYISATAQMHDTHNLTLFISKKGEEA